MKRYHTTLLLLITTLLLMAIALYNGYPILNSDSGSYIYSGITNILGADRPLFYGWFIHYSSFWTSLWFTIFFQCLILAYLLIKYIALIQKKIPERTPALITVIAITSFTCVSWISSYLMPDIWAGILLLAILLYLCADKAKKMPVIIYVFIIYFSMLVHNSHFLIVTLFALALLIWAMMKKHKPLLKKCVILLAVACLSWASTCTVSQIKGYGFTYSRSSHVFIMGRLCEMGILKTYLDDNCKTKNLKLCNYKDQLPVYEWEFLWNNESPFYKTGGWDSSKTEYTYIIHDIVTTPKYLQLYVQKSFIGGLRELTQIKVPDHAMVLDKNSSPGQAIAANFADELNEYLESMQRQGDLSGTTFNMVYCLFFILSTIWVLFNKKILTPEVSFIYGCIILFFVINAFITSTFSTVVDRFQNRIFWLLPATNAILMVKYYWGKYVSG